MLEHKNEYFFCFSLGKLELLDDLALKLETFTQYRIEIYRNERSVATSRPILCTPNEHSQVILEGELMKFRLYFEKEEGRESCEIRLLQMSEESPQQLIGCYQFLLNNYIKAYKELNRNCIELNVQIAEHYIITYEVFIERTEEAIQRIIKEHQAARRFNMGDEVISEIDSFLPHEITNQNLEEIYREIKIDEASPLLLSQRFWSPKRRSFKYSRNDSLDSSTNSKVLQKTNHTLNVDNRISFLKLNKSFSSSSELHPSNVWKFTKTASHIEELDVESQKSDDQHRKFFELYEVIKSDSKIILPEDLSQQGRKDNDLREEKTTEKSLKFKRSTKKYENSIKYTMLVAFAVVVLAFFIFLFERPTLSITSPPKQGRKAKKAL